MASMLVASVTFAFAVSLYPRLTIIADAYEYALSAFRLVTRGVFSLSPEMNAGSDAYKMPGYPLMLSTFFAAAGRVPLRRSRSLGAPYIVGVQFAWQSERSAWSQSAGLS